MDLKKILSLAKFVREGAKHYNVLTSVHFREDGTVEASNGCVAIRHKIPDTTFTSDMLVSGKSLMQALRIEPKFIKDDQDSISMTNDDGVSVIVVCDNDEWKYPDFETAVPQLCGIDTETVFDVSVNPKLLADVLLYVAQFGKCVDIKFYKKNIDKKGYYLGPIHVTMQEDDDSTIHAIVMSVNVSK